jgi:hypothetical protein
LGLLAVIGVEGTALNHESVLEEVNIDVRMLFETFHIALNSRNELFFCDEVQFFDAPCQNLSVYLFRKIISKRWTLEL